MAALQYVFNAVIQLYILVILVMVVLSWLISFNVVNRGNQFVDAAWRAATALTEPLLGPIRSRMPDLGGLDISPIVLLIGLQAAQIFGNNYVFGPLVRGGL
ncbi:MAG: YggT family protein [Pseudomonadota bacterium]